MEPRIIRTQAQYRRSLREVMRLAALDPGRDSRDGARLELLAKLVEEYEKSRYPFRKPDPVEAILFRMQEQGLRQRDVAGILGGKNRASEVLSRKRPLTLPMIRALHEKLAIAPELLIREPEAKYAAASGRRTTTRLRPRGAEAAKHATRARKRKRSVGLMPRVDHRIGGRAKRGGS